MTSGPGSGGSFGQGPSGLFSSMLKAGYAPLGTPQLSSTNRPATGCPVENLRRGLAANPRANYLWSTGRGGSGAPSNDEAPADHFTARPNSVLPVGRIVTGLVTPESRQGPFTVGAPWSFPSKVTVRVPSAFRAMLRVGTAEPA